MLHPAWVCASTVSPTCICPQKEQDSLGLESHEYRIKIGQVACDIQIVSDKVIHCSVNESLGTAEGQLPITVSSWDRNWGAPHPFCHSACPSPGTSGPVFACPNAKV